MQELQAQYNVEDLGKLECQCGGRRESAEETIVYEAIFLEMSRQQATPGPGSINIKDQTSQLLGVGPWGRGVGGCGIRKHKFSSDFAKYAE